MSMLSMCQCEAKSSRSSRHVFVFREAHGPVSNLRKQEMPKSGMARKRLLWQQ